MSEYIIVAFKLTKEHSILYRKGLSAIETSKATLEALKNGADIISIRKKYYEGP